MRLAVGGAWVAAALAVLAGCRREDVREFSLTIDGLAVSNRAAVTEALARYGGIRKDSYVWDFERHVLTLKYDSMQIARENIRQAIEAKGLKVVR